MDKLKTFLKNLGLNDEEVEVYVSCLVMGDTSVLKISKHSKVKRGTTYNILNKLVEMGLVNSHQTKKAMHYYTSNPKKIITNLRKKIDTAEELMPVFDRFYREDKGESRVYVGNTGEDYENSGISPRESAKSGTEVLVFANIRHFYKESKSSQPWFDLMKNKKYKERVLIYGDGEIEQEYIERCKKLGNPNLKIRIIRKPEHPFNIEVAITDECVLMFTGERKFNILTIYSKQTVSAYRQIFEQLWKDGEDAY